MRNWLIGGAALLVVCVSSVSSAGVLLRDERKLTADVQNNEHFGEAVAIDGDVAVIGSLSGEVYVFERDADDEWSEVATLTESTNAFGRSVAVSGHTIAVGAFSDDVPVLNAGAVFVYQRDAGGPGAWGQVKKLTASDVDTGHNLGRSVSLSGDRLVATGDVTKAYVFERDEGGVDNWGEVTILEPSDDDPEGEIVEAVSVDGNTIVVGVPDDDDSKGAGYVFDRDFGGPETWGQVAKLTGSDATGDEHVGWSTSIHGDRVVLGAPIDEDITGSAYVFDRDEGGPDAWGEVEKLTGSDSAPGDWFGESVAIHGDVVVVGAFRHSLIHLDNGAAYVFERDAGGPSNWGETGKLVASDADGQEEFGASVAIDTNTALIGASDDFDVAFRGGGAYVYDTPIVRMFVTSVGYDGNLGGLSGADAICQAEADAAGEPRIWKALLSVPGVDKVSRVPAGLPIQRLDRESLADDAAGLAGDLDNPLETEPGGATAPVGAHVWTGDTDGDGNCLGFTATGGDTGVYGLASETDGDWHAAGDEACSNTNRLYCFRFTCPAVPDPSCLSFDDGSLIVSETKVGKEKLRIKLGGGPALTQAELGSPLGPEGTGYTACLYENADVLRGELRWNRAGDTCGTKPCWKPIGGSPGGKGWVYKDKERAEGGIQVVSLKGGAAGQSKIQIKGGNNVSKGQDQQPLGIARGLSGATSATVQIHGHDLAPCFSVELDRVQKDLGSFFQARR